MSEMFEKAVREKVRWHSRRGPCSVEDLWDRDVEALDEIHKGLVRQVKAVQEESLLVAKDDASETLDLQVAIVRRVVAVKLAETAEQRLAILDAARKQKLLSILAEKQDAGLLDLSEDELQAQIDAL